MKRVVIISIAGLVLALLVIGGYRLFTYLSYASVLKNEREQWLDEKFIPLKIKGVIYEFNKPLGNNCFSNLIIRQPNGEKFASGVCACDGKESFRVFASVGDSLIKTSGSRKIVIKKIKGESMEFDFPFCDL